MALSQSVSESHFSQILGTRKLKGWSGGAIAIAIAIVIAIASYG